MHVSDWHGIWNICFQKHAPENLKQYRGYPVDRAMDKQKSKVESHFLAYTFNKTWHNRKNIKWKVVLLISSLISYTHSICIGHKSCFNNVANHGQPKKLWRTSRICYLYLVTGETTTIYFMIRTLPEKILIWDAHVSERHSTSALIQACLIGCFLFVLMPT